MEEILDLVPKCLTSKEDLVFLYSIIFSKKPSNVLEIGRFNGGSSLIIAGALADNDYGKLFSVDIEDLVSSDVKTVLEYNTLLIKSSSTNLSNNPFLTDIKFQVFFIDGDHSIEMVSSDIIQCLSMSDTESVLLCHDADMAEVRKGIDNVLSAVPQLIDCGRYGSKIQMLIYKNTN